MGSGQCAMSECQCLPLTAVSPPHLVDVAVLVHIVRLLGPPPRHTGCKPAVGGRIEQGAAQHTHHEPAGTERHHSILLTAAPGLNTTPSTFAATPAPLLPHFLCPQLLLRCSPLALLTQRLQSTHRSSDLPHRPALLATVPTTAHTSLSFSAADTASPRSHCCSFALADECRVLCSGSLAGHTTTPVVSCMTRTMASQPLCPCHPSHELRPSSLTKSHSPPPSSTHNQRRHGLSLGGAVKLLHEQQLLQQRLLRPLGRTIHTADSALRLQHHCLHVAAVRSEAIGDAPTHRGCC